jgi:hypothetical protein
MVRNNNRDWPRSFTKIGLLLFLPFLLMAGCQSVPKVQEYSIAVKNGTSAPILEVDVRFDKFSSGGGYLRPGVSKTYELVPFPIPEKATVYWKSKDGKSHEKTVEVMSAIPKGFNAGDISFTIFEDEKVTVTTKPFLKLPKIENRSRRL